MRTETPMGARCQMQVGLHAQLMHMIDCSKRVYRFEASLMLMLLLLV